MKEEQLVTGIILYTSLVGEYDKRLVILTRERGKITVFANGARRANSQLRAASQSFVMGKFTVIAGREAYNLVKAEVTEYFSEISFDMEKLCYASYFGELMSYYTREGDFCRDNLNLLYVTLKALVAGELPLSLIRVVYVLRLMHLEGQGIHAFSCTKCGSRENLLYFDEKTGGLLCVDCAKKKRITKRISSTALYAIQYIESEPLGSLYGFKLKEEARLELEQIVKAFSDEYIEKKFKSLEILATLA